MWYKFMRVWPVLKTILVCGTVCVVIATIGNHPETAESPEVQLDRLEGLERQIDRIPMFAESRWLLCESRKFGPSSCLPFRRCSVA